MKKSIKIILFIFLLFSLWYLFVKPSDYIINFESKSLPGTINQSIKLWGKGLKTTTTLKQEDLNHIIQTFAFSDSVHDYHWSIIPIHDSLSKVSVEIKDGNLKNSIINKLKVPFTKTDFVKRSEKTVYDFMTVLKDHVDNFKVTIEGEEETPSKFFAYVTISKEQFNKAKGMMDNTNFISDVLLKNNIQFDGLPMVEVTHWAKKTDSLTYNFGFPIKKLDTLPDLGEIKFKYLNPKPALKAIFNGNYISSDRAWYALINYAENNSISIKETPLEVFHNNPQMGGDSKTWVTEVYMPIEITSAKD
ncbi:AraC family transcriptional regulator [Maribacter algicola]|uniref:AraC family transcriptional regulator n=1 Tax=Maribacter algicola TaxID=2498892 RepID=A0A3R8Q6A4_9FLAO|nr:AraC family transcriptional regulator [Maribacter algicola]RRQ50422.1 AraC family transcriptional regulator [Maribacter algicola]